MAQAVTVYRATIPDIKHNFQGGSGSYTWSQTFDAVEVEDITCETVVTENPVETGVSIADHAYDAPVKLSIKAAVSDVPAEGKEADLFTTVSDRRSLGAYGWLRQLQKAHEPFSVQTGLELFKDMVITSLRTTVDAAHSQILYFTVDLRQIIFVTTENVVYPARAEHQRKAAKKKDDGDKEAKPVEAPQAQKVAILKAMMDFLARGGQ